MKKKPKPSPIALAAIRALKWQKKIVKKSRKVGR